MSSLVVNTNISAITAYDSLNATDDLETKAINELSSGLAIQTAADGPAAFVTSQSLTAQSNGDSSAISNAQNDISLVQTASGALNQISTILQTMNQLALSSANGATGYSTSLAANQQEFAALQADINQIAGTTSYGTTNLLDGSFSSQALQVGAFDLSTQQISVSIADVSAASLGLTIGTGGASGTSGYYTSSADAAASATGGPGTFTFAIDGGSQETVNFTTTAGDTPADDVTTLQNAINTTFGAGKATVSLSGGALKVTSDSTGSNSSINPTDATGTGTLDLGLEYSAPVNGTGGSGGISIDTAAHAETAITAVEDAISTVDTVAAGVGATQNQLQAIAANLTVGQQNLTAAASQLVDVNMAQEMTQFSTDQILMQTGTAMLAQAQQSPSLVLKLV